MLLERLPEFVQILQDIPCTATFAVESVQLRNAWPNGIRSKTNIINMIAGNYRPDLAITNFAGWSKVLRRFTFAERELVIRGSITLLINYLGYIQELPELATLLSKVSNPVTTIASIAMLAKDEATEGAADTMELAGTTKHHARSRRWLKLEVAILWLQTHGAAHFGAVETEQLIFSLLASARLLKLDTRFQRVKVGSLHFPDCTVSEWEASLAAMYAIKWEVRANALLTYLLTIHRCAHRRMRPLATSAGAPLLGSKPSHASLSVEVVW
jgi:hypothetical protein